MNPTSAIGLLSIWLVVGGFFQAHDGLSQFRGMTIQRTGGFSGGEDEWYFSETGKRWTPEGVSLQAPIDKIQRLRDLVARQHKRNAGQSSDPISLCFDCYTFRITVWSDAGNETVEITEVSPLADKEDVELLRLVRELIVSAWPAP